MTRFRVLVVEDDAAMRDVLTDGLREVGHVVEAVASGTAAVELIQSAFASRAPIPQVIVTDMRMPGPNGLETVRRLRDVGCETFVFLVTGFGDDELRSEAYRLGVIEVFDKPFAVDDLRDAIQRVAGA